MKTKYFINKKFTILLFFIIFLGIFLRRIDYQTIPRLGATFDEFAWPWLGISLIQNKVPVSWSPHQQYENRQAIYIHGAGFWLVAPYLEHPPVFGLVTGAYALTTGIKDMLEVTPAKIRKLSLGLGALSILMVYLITSSIYGPPVGLMSALLYSTIPTVVIGSRLVQNENFLIPVWLTAIYFVNKYLGNKKRKYLYLSAVLCGLISLAKVPWLVAGLSVSMILSFKGKWKDAVFVGFVTAGFFSLFILYGAILDWDLFVSLWKLQIARYDISYAGFFSTFTRPLLVDRYFLDGWVLAGWFSIVFLLKNIKKHYLVAIPFLAYLIIYIFAIPDEPSHGWYRYPFLPFLLTSLAIFIKAEYKKISLAGLFVFMMIGLSLLSNTWEINFGFSYLVYRLFIVFLSASFLLPLWFGKLRKQSGKIVIFWMSIFILLNYWAVKAFIG
ncbi:ArnT family glycosyltransferase [Patescibacteria group bacterium]